MEHTKKKKANTLIFQDELISFPMLRIVFMFNSGFRSLSKFEFKCSGIQQWGAIVLDSMSFEALGCKGGASKRICTSRNLIFRVLLWHILGSTTLIMLPCMLTRGGTRLSVDSHIQRFILAT